MGGRDFCLDILRRVGVVLWKAKLAMELVGRWLFVLAFCCLEGAG